MNQIEQLPLYSEILPRLYLGGTDNSDVVHETRRIREAFITKRDFDTVITAYAYANPVSWGVKEIRTTFYDGDISDINFDDIHQAIDIAYADWKKGRTVLVRCQMGYNRSSFILCHVLVREGYTAKQAIALMREKRSPWVLCNEEFEDYLTHLDEPKETSVA